MINLLPAILVGGPPYAGKSVLFYRLTQALHEQGIEHYALRACPDGEGNWYHETSTHLLETLRVKLTEWPSSFVESINEALTHRSLPFLVDMGGRPIPSQECLIRNCTHSILLLKEDEPERNQHWQQLIEAHNQFPLARIISRPTGPSQITASAPILEGVITGLERNAAQHGAGAGPVFDALLACISSLFKYDLQGLRERNLRLAPTELPIDIEQEQRAQDPTSTVWIPAMLQKFLNNLPRQVPLSVYGRGPVWVYAALAAHVDVEPFYLFDPKLPFGWIMPIRISLGASISPRDDIKTEVTPAQTFTTLTIRLPEDRLSYLQPEPLIFPLVPLEHGLILNGKLPNWLLTALVQCYKAAGIAWIASFYPPLEQGIVIFSRLRSPQIGDLVPSTIN